MAEKKKKTTNLKVKNDLYHTYVFDFENRCSDIDKERKETSIWLYDICSIDTFEHKHGTTIEDFIETITYIAPCTLYSHNLKFDISFIFYYFLQNNYEYSDELTKEKQYNALIDEMGRVYQVSLIVKKDKKLKKINFRDSTKKIVGSVREIALAYNLPILKGEIKYDLYRPKDYEPTKQEIKYIENDTEIIARVLQNDYKIGMVSLTSSSDSYKRFQKSIGTYFFNKVFPSLTIEEDTFCRKSYFGGKCFVNPRYKGKLLKDVYDYDRNSMYPFIMAIFDLPYGKPKIVKKEGRKALKIETNETYKLFIVHLFVNCKIKPKTFPTLDIKSVFFMGDQPLYDTENEMKEFYLTSVDYYSLHEFYNVYDEEILEIYYFKASNNIFREYIEELYEKKNNSVGAEKMTIKRILNSLYGKFAQNPNTTNRKPILDKENETIVYEVYKEQQVAPKYVALASFITSYGRNLTMEVANLNYDIFVYCDTDSDQFLGNNIKFLDKDEKKLGWFKLEHHFSEVKYLGKKCYLGIENGKTIRTIAGLPKSYNGNVNFENFDIGKTYKGAKLFPKQVKGGIILYEGDYTIFER